MAVWSSLGKVTVTTSGTPVRLTNAQSTPSTRVQCHAIMVQVLPSNTGRIVIGDGSSVNASTYVSANAILAIPTNNILPSANVGISEAPNAINAADYWIDSTVNGDGVIVSILIA